MSLCGWHFIAKVTDSLSKPIWLCRRFMEHFSRAVTDDAFTAELLREATNCDVLSLCVRMYICIYVYTSHSTRDTLIAQLPTVCRRRA